MCVIAFSPKGKDMPTEEQIKQMFKKNPDGAGFAYEEGNTVKFKKGFMNVDDLLEELGPLENWKNKNIAMHFRIGTAGKNDKKTTHPFPLSTSFGDLRKLEGEGPVLFHNGVISGLGGLIDPLASDTQDFVSGVASKLLTKPHKPSKITNKIVEEIIGASRLLLMYGKGKIIRFGEWKEKDGNLYSNLLWIPSTYTYKPSSSYYDFYDDDYNHHKGHQYEQYENQWAWPTYDHQWIKVPEERGKLILQQAEWINGTNRCKFKTTNDLEWYTTEDLTQWWTTKAQDYMNSENSYNEIEEEDDELYSDYKFFNTFDEMEKWLSNAIILQDGTYEKNGKCWYADERNCEVFTKIGAEALTEVADVKAALDVCAKLGYLPIDEEELLEAEEILQEEKEKQCVLH